MRKVGDKIKIKSFEEITEIAKLDSRLYWLKAQYRTKDNGYDCPFNFEMKKYCDKSFILNTIPR